MARRVRDNYALNTIAGAIGASGDFQISPPAGSLTSRSGTITAGANTSQTLMAANASRKYVFFQNVGTDTVWLDPNGGTAVATQPCIKLTTGSVWEPAFIPVGAITILSPTNGNAFTSFEA